METTTNETEHAEGCPCRDCERVRRWAWEDHMDEYEAEVRAHGGTVDE